MSYKFTIEVEPNFNGAYLLENKVAEALTSSRFFRSAKIIAAESTANRPGVTGPNSMAKTLDC